MSESTISVQINGQSHSLPAGTTLNTQLSDILRGDSRRGIAVALNLEVIPAEEWSSTALADGDRLEIIIAAAGG